MKQIICEGTGNYSINTGNVHKGQTQKLLGKNDDREKN